MYSEVTDKKEKTHSVSYYGYDAFGRRILEQDKDEAALRSLYDGFTFDVVKQSPTFTNGLFVDSYETGIRINITGKPTGDRYRYLEDTPQQDGNRYFHLDEGNYRNVSSRYKGSRTALIVNGTIAGQNADGEVSYFTTDLLGTVRTTTDGYGYTDKTYSYDAFGAIIERDLSGRQNFGYLGKQFDKQTGLYNYGYRDYTPKVARFTTVDPIRDGENWVIYCRNDSVNFVDFTGYEPVTIAIGVGAAVITTAAVIAITQSEPYQEAVKEVASQVGEKLQEANNTINEIKKEIIVSTTDTIKNALSKGKTERDGEGNPIPPANQKQSPLGKGSNGGPEDIGDPGDLGGGNFPDGDPKIMLATAAILAGVTQIGTDNKEFKEKLESIPKLSNNSTTTQEIILKQGSTDAKNK